MRWGIIGLGGLVRERVAPVFAYLPGSVIAACVGSTPEKTRVFARQFGVERCYRGIEELAADPDLDAIYVATPNALHHPMVLAAARGGKHVLCEKPLALAREHGIEMIEACRRAGVILRVAFQIRLEATLNRARELIRSGALGELRAVVFDRNAPVGQRTGWRMDFAQGGIVFDVAVHLIDQMRWLTGLEFSEVSAYSHPDRRAGLPDDSIAILARLGGSCHAALRATRELPYVANQLTIEGTRGTLATSELRWTERQTLTIRTDAGAVEEHFPATPLYQREFETFEREVAGAAGVLATGEDGLRALEVTQAVLDSINSRRSVAL